ncbi:toll-like receptor 22 [Nematolebias whitei]|uniref:toll-like receptor 22 n=1 Tax=Nematolebias whitei TaxID=451745 RepID=UPI0018992A65|nr:toll-like receptor 22 [Nematolebias whitei]
MGSFSSRYVLKLLFLLLFINPSLAYSLKNCTLDYQESPDVDVSLDCASRNLITIPDDIPRDAVSIQLYRNQIQKVNMDHFRGMSKLRHLDLGYNQIAFENNAPFTDLILLETLIMGNNNLTSVTGNMFQGLSNLIMLDLSDNKIQSIDASAVQFLISLQSLDLGNNMLQKVSDIQPILQLPKIQRLCLRFNLFSSFETKDMLGSISSLKVLNVSGHNLERFSITTPVFPYLQILDFSKIKDRNTLKWDIPDKTLLRNITQLNVNQLVFSFEEIQKVLQSLSSLKHLRLNYVDVWIKGGLLSTVCKIPTLRKLDLFYNHLSNLTWNLMPCSQLTELNLKKTHINELPQGSLQRMKKLNALHVNMNLLTKVPPDIRSLTFLQILNMDNNLITELNCEDFVNTTHLAELYLNTNHITRLDKCVVEHLTDLKLLGLSNNLLLTFGDTFKVSLQKLEILDLSQNVITILENGNFQSLQSLKQLNVASKSIQRVKRATFQGLINLEDLTLSFPLDYEPTYRGLQNLENLTILLSFVDTFKVPRSNSYEAYVHLKSLKSLAVICTGYHYGLPLDVPMQMFYAMKHLENFKAVNIYINAPKVDTFQFNPQLKNLTITSSDLSDLDPELFLPIPNLEILDFSESELTSLDFLEQADLPALRYLKVTDNNIVEINETIFNSLPSLTYLDLDNNPFTCECANVGFIQWIKENKQIQVVNAHQYKCSFPVDKQGTLLLDFDVQSCWNDGSFSYFISSTCLVVLTLLTSFIYHFLRWYLAYTFHLFLAFIYDNKMRKKVDPHQFDAFVSYNVHDEDWVYREMLPVLEGEQGWRLCLHHRDFQPGKPIMENITDAIYGSRKTICVISRHYLQSEWCSREIQMASFRLFDEQKDVLILLFLEEIPPHHLSPYYRLRKLVKKRTYLSWPQAAQHPGVFWQNVQRALQTGDVLTEDTDLLTGP